MFWELAMYFNEFVATFPQTLLDRRGLSCTADDGQSPEQLARRFAQNGVLLFRNVLPAPLIRSLLERCLAFGARLQNSAPPPANGRDVAAAYRDGVGNYVWEFQDDDEYFLAPLIPALIRSRIWPTVEAICGSRNVVILLSLCITRHMIDESLGLGAHQDAVGFGDDVPFSIWIPLQDVRPGACSGLGFVAPPPTEIVPHQNNTDMGEDYLLDRVENVWLPTYGVGDLSIHHNLTPHFTTGFGTKTERFSVEVRCMSMETAPDRLQDPAMYVVRRDRGEPMMVKSRASRGHIANGYLSSPDAAGTPMRTEHLSPPWVYREY